MLYDNISLYLNFNGDFIYFQVVESVAHHTIVQLPPTQRKPKPAKRCRVCYSLGKRKESRYYCPACPSQPGLCPKECFAQYHSNEYYKYNARTIQRSRMQYPATSSTPLGISQTDYISLTLGSSIAGSCNTSPRSLITSDMPSTSLENSSSANFIDVVNAWHQNNDTLSATTTANLTEYSPLSPLDKQSQVPLEGSNRQNSGGNASSSNLKNKEDTTDDVGAVNVCHGDDTLSTTHSYESLTSAQSNRTAKEMPLDGNNVFYNSPEHDDLERKCKKFSSSTPNSTSGTNGDIGAKPMLRRRSSARLRRLSSAGGQTNV